MTHYTTAIITPSEKGWVCTCGASWSKAIDAEQAIATTRAHRIVHRGRG